MDRKSDPRKFSPDINKGADPDSFVAGTAKKDSLTGKNVVQEYRTGKPSRGAGKDGALNQRP